MLKSIRQHSYGGAFGSAAYVHGDELSLLHEAAHFRIRQRAAQLRPHLHNMKHL